jgi:hypothetical protein
VGQDVQHCRRVRRICELAGLTSVGHLSIVFNELVARPSPVAGLTLRPSTRTRSSTGAKSAVPTPRTSTGSTGTRLYRGESLQPAIQPLQPKSAWTRHADGGSPVTYPRTLTEPKLQTIVLATVPLVGTPQERETWARALIDSMRLETAP